MRYVHRKTGAPVEAIQLTGSESAARITKEFACHTSYKPDKALLVADGTTIKRGQYAVLAMCSIVAMDQTVFDDRFKKVEFQEELFPENSRSIANDQHRR